MRASARQSARFSSRDSVGWLIRSAPLSGARPHGDLQGRIGAQRIDVVAVLVAGRDHDHPRHRHLGVAVPDAGRIAVVTERSGDRLGQPEALGDLAQHDDAAVRRQAAGIERGCERLALDR